MYLQYNLKVQKESIRLFISDNKEKSSNILNVYDKYNILLNQYIGPIWAVQIKLMKIRYLKNNKMDASYTVCVTFKLENL